MVQVLTDSKADFVAAGLQPYNRTQDGGAAEFVYQVIQRLTLHTYMPRLLRLERNFTKGGITGAQVLKELMKLEESNVVPAELFHDDEPDSDAIPFQDNNDESNDTENAADTDADSKARPFDKMETPKFEMPEDSNDESLDDVENVDVDENADNI